MQSERGDQSTENQHSNQRESTGRTKRPHGFSHGFSTMITTEGYLIGYEYQGSVCSSLSRGWSRCPSVDGFLYRVYRRPIPKKTGASRNFYPFGVFHLKSYGTFYRRSEKANSVSRWWAAELLHDAHRYLAYPSHRVTDLGKFFFWVMA